MHQANRDRAWNIPSGRVSQRLAAFQNDSKSTPSSNVTPKAQTPNLLTSTPVTNPSHAPTPQFEKPEESIENEQEYHEAETRQESMTSLEEKPVEEPEVETHRGRPAQRPSSIHMEPRELSEMDDVLEDVRSRLYSVQKIVRREQSGDSEQRDEMLSELGTMLDDAILTTMTPLHAPHPLTRNSSSRRPSPLKQSSEPPQLGRSQSVKAEDLAYEKDHFEPVQLARSQSVKTVSPGQASNEPTPPTSFQSPPKSLDTFSRLPKSPTSLRRHVFEPRIERHRQRQNSEPASFIARRTGFPLSSPVRERALL